MNVDFSDRRTEGVVGKNVILESVWEERIKIDEVKGGVKVFFSGSDEESGKKMDTDCFRSDASHVYRKSSSCHFSRKRKTWNRFDTFHGFSQLPAQEKSRTPDSAGVENNVAAVDDPYVLCVEAKVVNEKMSASTVIEDVWRSQVQEIILSQNLCNNVDPNPIAKSELRNKNKEEENLDEKRKKKKKIECNEIYAAEQKFKKLMDENKRRKSGEAHPHSLIGKSQKSLAKSSEFHAAFNRSRSQHRKPSANVLMPSTEPALREVRKYSPVQLQVDLLAWTDFSKSKSVLLIGTFIIIAASFVRVLNISLVTTVSYLGLSYLAIMFTYRSLIHRECEYAGESSLHTVMSEEEAIKILKATLPYFNKFISALKSLFSGDPAMTLKVSAPLLIFARCGSCISFWNIAVTGFFALFTIRKLYLMYSSQLKENGENWVRTLIIAKNLCCKYKTTIAIISFFLVWNFCSTIERIWALFMVLVATRYYQQSMSMKP